MKALLMIIVPNIIPRMSPAGGLHSCFRGCPMTSWSVIVTVPGAYKLDEDIY